MTTSDSCALEHALHCDKLLGKLTALLVLDKKLAQEQVKSRLTGTQPFLQVAI